VGVTLLIIGSVRFYKERKVIAGRNYSGKVMFKTEEEYSAFKLAIGNDKVTSFSADVMSSKPPIIVQFNANTLPDYKLNYGKEWVIHKDWEDDAFPLLWGFGAGIAIISIVGFFFI
jgi:hypothetical protein